VITAAIFRSKFLEFADSATFPNSMVDYYIALSGKLINNPERWGDLEDDGKMLFVAHHCVLEAEAMRQALAGGVPGKSTGVISEKHVDKVSVGYDTALGAEAGAGHWNLTIYGIRLMNLYRLIGAGPVQIGIGTDPASSLSEAWSGPPQYQFPNPS
jgi:hypothetical protein